MGKQNGNNGKARRQLTRREFGGISYGIRLGKMLQEEHPEIAFMKKRSSEYIATELDIANNYGCSQPTAIIAIDYARKGHNSLWEVYKNRLAESYERLPDTSLFYLDEQDEPADDVDVSEEVDKRLLVEKTQAILNTLSQRERDVIKRIYGLGGYSEQTYREIGRALRVSGSRIGQIHAKAIRKLQCPCRAKILEGFVDSALAQNLRELDALTEELRFYR